MKLFRNIIPIVVLGCLICHEPSLGAKQNKHVKKTKIKKRKSSKNSILTPPAVWRKPSPTWHPDPLIKPNKHFVIIVMSYNNKDWAPYNLDSILAQKYPFYRIIYIDDASPDGTSNVVTTYINKKQIHDRITLICNQQRRTKTANVFKALHLCKDHEIAVILDGDDWFAHRDVLTYLNEQYCTHDIWLTYGGFKPYPKGKANFCVDVPQEAIKTNNFRKVPRITSAQRSFYAWLYKHLKLEDLMYKGKFMPMAGDVAKMYPMFEMAGPHFKRIDHVVYIYNRATPINDDKVGRELQSQINECVLSKEKYTPLNHPGIQRSLCTSIDTVYFENNGLCENDLTPSLSEYVLLLRKGTIIKHNIDLITCAHMLDKTHATACFLDIDKGIFDSNNLPYEELEKDFYAWQFGYGPPIDFEALSAFMVNKSDIEKVITNPEQWFEKNKVGLFFYS